MYTLVTPGSWGSHGMVLPMQGAVAWGAAVMRGPFSRLVSHEVIRTLGATALPAYMLQAPVRRSLSSTMGVEGEGWNESTFIYLVSLAAVALAAHHVVVLPLRSGLVQLWEFVKQGNVRVEVIARPHPDDREEGIACAKAFKRWIIIGGVTALQVALTYTAAAAPWGEWSRMLQGSKVLEVMSTVIGYGGMGALPLLVVGTLGLLFYPNVASSSMPKLDEILDTSADGVPHLRHRIAFRLAPEEEGEEAVLKAESVLLSCLPPHLFSVGLEGEGDNELGEGDWIVRVGARCSFGPSFVRAVLAHCAAEEDAVAAGYRQDEGGIARIGVGPALGGSGGGLLGGMVAASHAAAQLGCLRIDTVFGRPVTNTPPGFVVCTAATERAVGTSLHPAALVTAACSHGARISWVGGVVRERPSAGLHEAVYLAKKRAQGRAAAVVGAESAVRKAVLMLAGLSAALQPLAILGFATLLAFHHAPCHVTVILAAGLCSGHYAVGYTCADASRGGWIRYLSLGFLQLALQPLFALLDLLALLPLPTTTTPCSRGPLYEEEPALNEEFFFP
eukprot:Hpha_TRINITY_DN15277_c1_g3::TRINITY_DN15277_c1_g3_i2::g.67281::m.67281